MIALHSLVQPSGSQEGAFGKNGHGAAGAAAGAAAATAAILATTYVVAKIKAVAAAAPAAAPAAAAAAAPAAAPAAPGTFWQNPGSPGRRYPFCEGLIFEGF